MRMIIFVQKHTLTKLRKLWKMGEFEKMAGNMENKQLKLDPREINNKKTSKRLLKTLKNTVLI